MKKKKLSLKEYLIDYLTYDDPQGLGISVLDTEFHDKVGKEYPHLKRKAYLWGCMPVPAVMRTLERLYKDYRVLRFSQGVTGGNWQPGFPKWVYTYYMQEDCRMERIKEEGKDG